VKLLLATTSAGKIREQRSALEALGREIALEIVTLESWPGLEPPVEPGPTFSANAAAKALYYHRATGIPSLGEDSGLEVDALGGEPGIHSARWLGAETPYEAKNARLLELLADTPDGARTARYLSAVALADEGGVVFAAEGVCEGHIPPAARGGGGFGYDPVFFYPPFGKTMAELTAEEKNTVSHRGRAMARLCAFLRSR